jgi:predicted secreted hydrolase
VIRRFILILLTLLLILAAGLVTAIFIFRHPTPVEFQQATVGEPVRFPRDEAAHFDAQTEWWYYTGFLDAEDGQQYGFELVFFKAYVPSVVRIGNVLPLMVTNNPIYFAHFAVSDQAAQQHVFVERADFPEFWDAGASEDRFEVWNGDWRAWGGGDQTQLQAGGGRYRLRLALKAIKPPVLHGPEGAGVVEMGQAGTSYYYSQTDLVGAGTLTVDGSPQTVHATAWMDHQWGSWDAHAGYAGWDWFSLRLDDGSRVMLFDFRDEGGNVQPESAGTWIGADGSTEHLARGDYAIEALEYWTSPQTGGTYPVKWQVSVPDRGLDVTVEATFPEQEMPIQLGPIYWEGSVAVSGTASGVGFVEMTGYAGTGYQVP